MTGQQDVKGMEGKVPPSKPVPPPKPQRSKPVRRQRRLSWRDRDEARAERTDSSGSYYLGNGGWKRKPKPREKEA